MAELISNTLAEAGLAAAKVSLFSFGGNGPMFGAFVADKLGIASAYAFDFGPVFGAFGSSISDVAHVYERGVGLPWSVANQAAILAAATKLHMQAVRDLQGEGFDPAKASFRCELEFGRDERIAGTCRYAFSGEPGAAFIASAEAAIAEAGLKGTTEPVLLLRITARYEVGVNRLQRREDSTMAASAPGTRDMQFNGRGAEPLPVHVWEQLAVGAAISGPAMINGATLTCPVPPGWRLAVDAYGNAVMGKAG
jgi:N-methylhydantoinase A/oxoprolinase/acetone carboxylase beta subunit